MLIASDAGHLGDTVEAPIGREMAELASAFSDMSLKLRRHTDDLEDLVRERTADLEAANRKLALEMAERQHAEQEQREYRDRLWQSQKEASLSSLAGGVAHHINNLLTVIQLNAEEIAKDLPPRSAGLEHLRDVREAAARGADIGAQLLAYAGHGPVAKRELDLSEVIRSRAALLHAAVPDGVDLRLELAEDLLPVMANDRDMLQLLFLLLTNAVEATLSEGGVVISTSLEQVEPQRLAAGATSEIRPGGDYVALKVTDDGVGMDAETRRRAFDPFFSTKMPGRGLGLAVAQGIVRGLGGTVLVDSEPGRGSTFTVLLPAVRQPDAAKACV